MRIPKSIFKSLVKLSNIFPVLGNSLRAERSTRETVVNGDRTISVVDKPTYYIDILTALKQKYPLD